MTGPRLFQVSRSLRISNRIGIAVLGALGLACAAAATWADFGPNATPVRIMFGVMALFFGGLATGLFGGVKVGETSYALRDDGLEILRKEEAPVFVGWGEVVGLRFTPMTKGFDLIGVADHPLGKIDASIEGLGEFLNVIVRKAVIPKTRVVLPWRGEKRYPASAMALFALAGLICLAPIVGLAPQGKLLAGLIFPAIFGLAWLIESLGVPRAVVVDRDGIRLEHALSAKSWSWTEIQGASLAVLRGSKGALSLGVALKLIDDRWQVLRVPGVDPVEMLSAIGSIDPARVIPGPDRISLASGRPVGGTGSTFTVKTTWKIGR